MWNELDAEGGGAFYNNSIPPELVSPSALRAYLGLTSGEEKFLRNWKQYRYHRILIPKRKGGHRALQAPDARLKFLQRKLLSLFEVIYTPRNPVHGFTKSRGVITNAAQHQLRPYLLNIDLEDFFPSITEKRVAGVFNRIGIDREVVDLLIDLTMVQNQLPQGAPTSPIISNMICFRFDRQLMQFAGKNHLKYTRYADDITLSSFRSMAGAFNGVHPSGGHVSEVQLSANLRQIIATNGFKINSKKTWYAEKSSRKEVTGLIVNKYTNIKRNYIRNIRSSIYIAEKLGVSNAERKYFEKYGKQISLKNSIKGKLDWVAQVRGRSFSAYITLASRYNMLFPESPLTIAPAIDEIIDKSIWVYEWAEGVGENFDCQQGTAVFISGVGLVSSYHVVEDLPDGCSVKLFHPGFPGPSFHATPRIYCAARDLVIFEHNVPTDKFTQLIISNADTRKGTPITAYGFPSYSVGDELNHRLGEITSTMARSGVRLGETSAILSSGMSGGPILNERSEVVGIIKSGGFNEERQILVHAHEITELVTKGPI